MNDLRFAFRQLLKNPGFTAVTVLRLALGIGANTAMFSIVNGLMLRPWPYPDEDRLVTVWTENRRQGANRQTSTYANVADWRKTARTLQQIAIYDPMSLVLTLDEPRRISGILASANLSAALGVQPKLRIHSGRTTTSS